jgi:hypothetical protein
MLTASDRKMNQLRTEIRQHEIWLAVDANDRRAKAWHESKIASLRRELHELIEKE